MIRVIDFHIGRAIFQSTFFSLLVLTSLSGLIRFVDQLKSIGRGNYDIMDVCLYVLYTMPRDIEVFFPMAALLGGLLGMGALASNSELIVMMAAGLSKMDIIKSAMKATTILVVLVIILGEWVAPQFESKANQLRRSEITGGMLVGGEKGIWAKDGDNFIHIERVLQGGVLEGLTLYQFDDKLELTKVIHAEQAKFDKDKWLVTNANSTHIDEWSIRADFKDSSIWQSSLTPAKLGIVSVSPEALSIGNLIDYLDYLDSNQQDGSRYELALWRKLFQPITVAVMMLMALSFVFGPLRSTSMGARIMMGVMIGFGFHIANRIFGPVSLVFDLPAMIGALMPSLIFVFIASYMIKRQL